MEITLEQAISLLKSGGQPGNLVISDLATSSVKAMDALLPFEGMPQEDIRKIAYEIVLQGTQEWAAL